MALTRLNYAPGQYETCTNETLTPASPVLNTWYHFEIGDWKHLLSDIVLKQGGSAIPAAAFELAEDTKYTAREATESGKTIYAKWRIVDGDYDAIATTVSGNNFGSYIDNEKLDARLDALEEIKTIVETGSVSGASQNIDIAIAFSKVVDVSLVSIVAAGNRYIISSNGVLDDGSPSLNYFCTNNSGNLRLTVYWSVIDYQGISSATYQAIVRYTP